MAIYDEDSCNAADSSTRRAEIVIDRKTFTALIHCPGTTGHSSLLLKNTAGEKARIVIERFTDFRKKEFVKFESGNPLGEITTVNITSLKSHLPIRVNRSVKPIQYFTGMVNNQDEVAVHNFREYLKIRSVHPNPDYDGCVAFLKKLGLEIGFKPTVVNLTEDRPVLILTLEGELPELPSILLNSHMDVVPVFKEHWDYDPFGAIVDEEGNIYGRGAQDMKCATIAEIEAIRRLKLKGIKLKRTVHMTILPDEEIGSKNGMEMFVETEAFKNLNVGFDVDEGIISTDRKMEINKNERFRWPLLIHCPGTTGHSSLLLKDTAGEKARIVIERFMDFRKKELDKFESGNPLGEITTVNITSLKGGIQSNVVPPEFIIGIDLRISADTDPEKLEKWIEDVCKEAGNDVYPEFIRKDIKAPEVPLENNSFWRALERVLKESDVEFFLTNGFAASDARFVRKLGIPVLGLSPFFNTESRIHGHNEYLNRKVFLEGITHYEKIIESLANC